MDKSEGIKDKAMNFLVPMRTSVIPAEMALQQF
jgi:hypothetical protein